MVSYVKKTQIWTWEKIKNTHQYGVGGGRLGMILKKQFAAIVGVWGAIANKMVASLKLLRNFKKHVFFGKNNPSPSKLSNGICFKKKASKTVIFDFLKACVEKLERNYINIWGSGAIAPRSQQHFEESDKMEA